MTAQVRRITAAAGRRPDSAAPAVQRKGIQSVEVGIRVIDALADSRGPLPLKDVARLSGLSASQAHRYLTSYLRAGLVRQDAATGHYDLGDRALRWGLAAMSRIDAVELAGEALKRLSARLDATGMLSVWGPLGATCVRLQRGSSLIATDVGLGTVFPVLGSATGQVFLAYLPERLTRPHVERGQLGRAAEIRAQVLARGYAQAEGHFINRLSAIGAPVLDFQGELVCVLVLVVRTDDLGRLGQSLTRGLLDETRALSQALGNGG